MSRINWNSIINWLKPSFRSWDTQTINIHWYKLGNPRCFQTQPSQNNHDRSVSHVQYVQLHHFSLEGGISWVSICQELNSHSSSEAKTKATDKLTKRIRALKNVMRDLQLHNPQKYFSVWNDNCNCVEWVCGLILKSVCHIDICDAVVCNSVQNCEIQVKYIIGKLTSANLFTKEIQDNLQLCTLWDLVVCTCSWGGADAIHYIYVPLF